MSALLSCGSEDVYLGDIYDGQTILPPADVDVSDLAFAELSLENADVIAQEIGRFDSPDERTRMIEWSQAAQQEIMQSVGMQRENKRLTFICEYLDFFDFDYIEYYQNSRSEREYVLGLSQNETRDFYKLVHRPYLENTFERFFLVRPSDMRLSSSDEVKAHKFLLANCPKYNTLMTLIQVNPLRLIQGKVSDTMDVSIAREFIDRAKFAIAILEEGEKAKFFADAVCQVISRKPKKPYSESQLTNPSYQYKIQFNELETQIFDVFAKDLGIAKTNREKRIFRKRLSEICPYYEEWVTIRREEDYIEAKLAYAFFSDENAMLLDNLDHSYKVPDHPFDSIKGLSSHMNAMSLRAHETKSKWIDRTFTEEECIDILSSQTCQVLDEIDLTFITDRRYATWQYLSEYNYTMGVESKKDLDFIIYHQMCSLYNEILNDGKIVYFNKGRKYSSTQHPMLLGSYNESVRNKCGSKKAEYLEALQSGPFFINEELFNF